MRALRVYLTGRPASLPLWPGKWRKDAVQMLRRDLAAAGVAYVVEGPDGPPFADLHSLRHTYVARLDRAGISLQQAMPLARHSDPRLPMVRYGRAQLHDLGAAVGQLPGLVPVQARETLPATGTEGMVALVAPTVALAADGRCGPMRANEVCCWE